MNLQYDEQDQMADHSRLIIKYKAICLLIGISPTQKLHREPSGSVIECLTRDREATGSSLTGVTASWSLTHFRHIYPSLVLVQPRKTLPCLTERLLMGGKESNQTKQTKIALVIPLSVTKQNMQAEHFL